MLVGNAAGQLDYLGLIYRYIYALKLWCTIPYGEGATMGAVTWSCRPREQC